MQYQRKVINNTFENHFLILQYNINNSRTKTMILLLKNKEIQEYDILTIQNHDEISSFSRFTILVEAIFISHKTQKKKLFFYINKRLSTNK